MGKQCCRELVAQKLLIFFLFYFFRYFPFIFRINHVILKANPRFIIISMSTQSIIQPLHSAGCRWTFFPCPFPHLHLGLCLIFTCEFLFILLHLDAFGNQKSLCTLQEGQQIIQISRWDPQEGLDLLWMAKKSLTQKINLYF